MLVRTDEATKMGIIQWNRLARHNAQGRLCTVDNLPETFVFRPELPHQIHQFARSRIPILLPEDRNHVL